MIALYRLPQWPACRLFSLSLAAVVVGCQAQSVSGTGPATEAALLQHIAVEIGDARCSSSAQCHTLPIGSKACGGPAQWRAWSSSVSDGARLQAWAQALAQQQRLREDAAGMVSTCSIVPDPGAVCIAGHCVTGRANSAR